jgi:hypothetical protein
MQKVWLQAIISQRTPQRIAVIRKLISTLRHR